MSHIVTQLNEVQDRRRQTDRCSDTSSFSLRRLLVWREGGGAYSGTLLPRTLGLSDQDGRRKDGFVYVGYGFHPRGGETVFGNVALGRGPSSGAFLQHRERKREHQHQQCEGKCWISARRECQGSNTCYAGMSRSQPVK